MARLVGRAARVRIPGAGGTRRLVVRSTSLGDFAVFLPFLATVDRMWSADKVDLLTISRSGNVARALLNPARDQIAVIDPTSFRALFASIKQARRTFGFHRYEEILYATQNSDTASYRLRKLAIVRAVVGMVPKVRGVAAHPAIRSREQLAEHLGDLATNQALAPFLACGMVPGATRKDVWDLVSLSAEEIAAARLALSVLRRVIERESLIAIYAHAKDARKRWPIDRYRELARRLLNESDASLCFIGGAEDFAATNEITSTLPSDRVVNLAGRLTVRETLALLNFCGLFLGNDGSPAHFAALAGCRVVTLFCNWEVVGLWEPIAAPRSVSVRPAPNYLHLSEHSIETISADLVLRAVRAVRDAGHRHRIWTVDGVDFSEQAHSLSPFATQTE